MTARKDDTGKVSGWRHVPWRAFREVVRVLEYGHKKYDELPDDPNWKKLPNAAARYHDALFRHVTAWSAGEVLDPDTSIHHLAHAAANCLFLIWFHFNPVAETVTK